MPLPRTGCVDLLRPCSGALGDGDGGDPAGDPGQPWPCSSTWSWWWAPATARCGALGALGTLGGTGKGWGCWDHWGHWEHWEHWGDWADWGCPWWAPATASCRVLGALGTLGALGGLGSLRGAHGGLCHSQVRGTGGTGGALGALGEAGGAGRRCGDKGDLGVPMVGSCHSQVRGAGGHWGHWEGLGGARRAGSTGLPGSSQWGQVRVGVGQWGATLHPQAPLTVMVLGLGGH